MKLKVLILFFFIAGLPGVFSKGINRERNISYTAHAEGSSQNLLDVYYPKNTEDPKDEILAFMKKY